MFITRQHTLRNEVTLNFTTIMSFRVHIFMSHCTSTICYTNCYYCDQFRVRRHKAVFAVAFAWGETRYWVVKSKSSIIMNHKARVFLSEKSTLISWQQTATHDTLINCTSIIPPPRSWKPICMTKYFQSNGTAFMFSDILMSFDKQLRIISFFFSLSQIAERTDSDQNLTTVLSRTIIWRQLEVTSACKRQNQSSKQRFDSSASLSNHIRPWYGNARLPWSFFERKKRLQLRWYLGRTIDHEPERLNFVKNFQKKNPKKKFNICKK